MDDDNQQPQQHVKFAVAAVAAATTTSSPSKSSSSSSTTTSAVGDDSDSADAYCLKCKKNTILYECDPCGCPSFCMDCAKKLASGGRCKTCKGFYGGLRRIRR
jgi:hypothetical protein